MLKEVPDKVPVQSKPTPEVFRVDEMIKLRKSDLKDKKKKDKIHNIVLYAFQEVMKFEVYQDILKEEKKKGYDIVKMESFRNQVM